ncbi:hypothetical protein [Lentzea sp. E54]|uniref:DUF7927 domain-containing protein n=1 Tax=Lentzea xerophila TaxID=3435883 RepID=UPI003DA48AB1
MSGFPSRRPRRVFPSVWRLSALTTAALLILVAGVGPGAGSSPVALAQPDHVVLTATVVTGFPAPAPTGNGYLVDYEVTVHNPGADTASYSLQQVLRFAPGTTVTSATAAGPSVDPSWNGTTNTTLAGPDTPISGHATHSFRLSVTASVSGSITEEDRACPASLTGSGGFSTYSSLAASTGDPAVVSACAPLSPVIAQVTGASTESGGEVSVTYDVTITNDSGAPSTYDLGDTLTAGAGITAVSAEVLRAPPGAANAAWTGSTVTRLATATPLAAGTRHRWTILVRSAVDPGDATSPHCASGGGMRNAATLISAGTAYQAEVCYSPALVRVRKSIAPGTPRRNADGTYTVEYDIVVENTGGDRTRYDLSTAFGFGQGISSSGPSAAGPLPVSATWNGTTDTAMATGAEIAAGESHTWRLSATATVGAGTTAQSLTCDPAGNLPSGLLATTTATATGVHVAHACAALPTAGITKVVSPGSPVANGDGSYTIGYDVTITNTGSTEGTYDLTDELRFGAGIFASGGQITGPVPVNPGWDGTTNTTVATGVGIPAGATHTWRGTGRAAVAPGTSPSGLICAADGTSPGGLLNVASTTMNGVTTQSHACAGLPLLTIAKTVSSGSPVANGDGSYTVGYDVTITNTGSGFGSYDLFDELRFGAGISASGGQISGPASVNPGWDGTTNTTVATGVGIPAGATHTWHGTGRVSVNPGADPAALACAPDGTTPGGLLNRVTARSNGQELIAHACASMPLLTIAKVVSPGFPRENGNGTHAIAYDITITNTGATTTAYDLADELRYGSGITATGLTVTGPQSANANWNGTTQTALADGVGIDPGGDHSWHIEGTVTVAGGVEPSALTCNPDGLSAGGLLNQAVTTGNGGSLDARACASLAHVTATKSLRQGYPRANGDGTFSVQYEITVTNPGGNTTTYDLADELRFGSGITASGLRVTAPPGVTSDPEWNGTVHTGLATAVAIPGGATHAWLVEATATAAPGIATSALSCSTDGSTPGGLLNLATTTANGLPVRTHACAGLPQIVSAKTVAEGFPKENGDGTYTVAYDVTVTNTGGGAGTYTLDDTFQFGSGLTASGASASGPATPSGSWNGTTDTRVIADLVIAGGGTHTWRLTALVTPDGITSASVTCDPAGAAPGGLRNVATTAANGAATPVHACAGLPLLSTSKVVGDGFPKENGDGTYTIAYDIFVTNNGDGPGIYSLDDTFRFGSGLTATGPAVTPPPGVAAAPSWNGGTDSTLATAVTVPARETHRWRVTTPVTVGAGISPASLACAEDGTTPGGLLNVVKTTANGRTTTEDACSALADVVITKEVADGYPRRDRNGLAVAYRITVVNSGAAASSYELTDSLRFGAGITAGTPVVTAPSGASPNPSWNGTTTTALGQVAAIEPGVTHTWTVELPVSGSGTAPVASLRCPAAGSTSAGALNNAAGLVVDGVTTTETACAGLPRLELVKTADVPTVSPGGKVAYKITATNIGGADQPGASLTDDLTDVLKQAAFANDARSDIGTVAYDATAARLTWKGDLAAGKTATVTYSVTANDLQDDGHALHNTIASPADSNCATPGDTRCEVTVAVARLDVSKIADSDVVQAGGKVTYTLLIQNSGGVAYGPEKPAVLTDDMTGVLDDAAYNSDAKADSGPAPTVTGSTLMWSGPLAVGQTISITYSVTAANPSRGDGVLDNGVTAADSNCAAGCHTKVTVGSSPAPPSTDPGGHAGLPKTGPALLGVTAIAVTLLVTGAVLLVAVRRRQE